MSDQHHMSDQEWQRFIARTPLWTDLAEWQKAEMMSVIQIMFPDDHETNKQRKL